MKTIGWFPALAIAGALALWPGSARAASVLMYNDVNEPPTVTNAGFPSGFVPPAPTPLGGEDFLQILPNALVAGHTPTLDIFGLTQASGGFSDLVTFQSLSGNNNLLVIFQSDAETPLVPAAPVFAMAPEAALGNTITLPTVLAGFINPALGGLTVTVFSDVVEVPEPASLVMFGTAAVFGLGYWLWRHRRKAAVA